MAEITKSVWPMGVDTKCAQCKCEFRPCEAGDVRGIEGDIARLSCPTCGGTVEVLRPGGKPPKEYGKDHQFMGVCAAGHKTDIHGKKVEGY